MENMENMNKNEATKRQLDLRLLGFLLAVPVGYLYWDLLLRDFPAGFEFLGLTIFSIIFIIWSEVILRGYKEKARKGTYFWYGVMVAASLLSGLAPDYGVSLFGVHLCAIYAVTFANNNLLGGKTSGLIPLDILNSMFIKGVGHFWKFFLDPADIIKNRKDFINANTKENEEPKASRAPAVFAGILVVIVAFIFLIIVVSLLAKVNEQFGDAIESFLKIFDFNWHISIGEIILKIIMAIPVAILLYAGIAKCASSDGASDLKAGEEIVANSKKLRVLKDVLINIVLGIFILIYIIFFVFEGSYIFGAFFGHVPTGFNVVAYARNGFFELIWVMVINMLIFLLVNSFTKESSRTKLNKALLITLMSTSIIFAIVSFTKLCFYFGRFGYTPKRILAMWGAVILLMAAVLVIVSIIKSKSYTREWVIFTVISYLLLCIISGGFKYATTKDVISDDDTIYVIVYNESSADISQVSMNINANMFDYYDLGTRSYGRPGASIIDRGDYYCFAIHGEDLPNNFLYGNYVVDIDVTFVNDPNIYTGQFTYDPSLDGLIVNGYYIADDESLCLDLSRK